MKFYLKKVMLCCLSVILLVSSILPSGVAEATSISEKEEPVSSDMGVEEGSLHLNCKSAVLMEATTGAVLYVQNPEEALPPASVTKIMTLLLLMEAIDAGRIQLDGIVTVSANAASMGGSQVYLKEGEQMTVEDLLKSVIIASANDAAVALAEYLYGSVEAFTAAMNKRAEQLEMKNTRFENVTGLDDTAVNHLTSAKDIAIMSRELIKHKTILKYSSIWMDSIRNGEFGLTNTNRLVRFYPGCTGLKTGSTSKAGFCISVTAEREGFSLICVIMGAESRDIRNAAATALLDWGFANYELFTAPAEAIEPIAVTGGMQDICSLTYDSFSCVLPKGTAANVEREILVPQAVGAPTSAGDTVGKIRYLSNGKELGSVDIKALENIAKIHFFEILKRMAAGFSLV